MSLLILGGTAEARQLAGRLRDHPGLTVALAGATQHPAALPVPVRRGGFGGTEGLARHLRAAGVSAVLDATHPFAVQMTAQARAACDACAVPYRQLLRPPWQPLPGEAWKTVPDAAAAAAAVPEGACVLWTVGRKDLAALAPLHRARVLIRLVDPPVQPFPLPRGRFVVARPPFSLPEEIALMRRERISWLVAKNAGGSAGRAKLEAARRLGVHVILIARPAGPRDRIVETVPEACDWVARGCPP